VMNTQTCQPLSGAAIDLWHCDAGGVYSGFTKQNRLSPGGQRGDFGPPPGGPPPGFDGHDRGFDNEQPRDFGPPPSAHSTDKLSFLRGIQITAGDGSAHFETVFPGFYMGRTNHIHFKVRLDGSSDGKSYQAGHTSHTGQVFFPENIAVKLMQSGPYTQNPIRRTTQSEDMVFGGQNGELFIATLRPMKPGHEGLEAELLACVDPTAVPALIGPGGRRKGPPPAND
jgi:protocatechuate 3,4-dioxygenase beta subunit